MLDKNVSMKNTVCNEITCSKLSVLSFGLAFGIVEAVFMILLVFVDAQWHIGNTLVVNLASLYKGLAPTFVGGLVGAFYGFVVGFVFGALIAWVYNWCLCCAYGFCKRKV